MGLGDERDDLAGVAVLRVLRPEGAVLSVFYHEAHEFHEVPDVKHAAPVLDFREYREFLRELAQERVVSFAALAKYHGRTEDDNLESVAI